MARPEPPQRSAYRFFHAISTRWHDNDVYGHVNNVVYYSWIDTAIAMYLTSRGLVDVAHNPVLPVVAETGCRYYRSIAFPDRVFAGVHVSRLGRSSATYGVGIFREEEDRASAAASFVHVYVDRRTMRPAALPPDARQALEQILS